MALKQPLPNYLNDQLELVRASERSPARVEGVEGDRLKAAGFAKPDGSLSERGERAAEACRRKLATNPFTGKPR